MAAPSRVSADKTRHGVVIARSNKNKITMIKSKQHAQFPANAAFVISPKRANANAGMKVRTAKNFRQTCDSRIHERLLRGGQPPKGALIRRACENHGRHGLSFPVRRSSFISAITFW